MNTLLLDQSFVPLTVVSWRRAISLLWLGKVEVLEEYDEEVHSPSIAVKLPAVVRLVCRIVRSHSKVRFSRQNIYLRDGGRCQYCGKEVSLQESTFDHVIPKSKNGKTKWSNIVIACQPCNLLKDNKHMYEVGMRLIKIPGEPLDIPYVVFKIRHIKPIPVEWKDYLASVIYWTAELARV